MNEFGEPVRVEFSLGEKPGNDKAGRLVERLIEEGVYELMEEFHLKRAIIEGWTVPPKVVVDFEGKTIAFHENGAMLQRNVVQAVRGLKGILGLALRNEFGNVELIGEFSPYSKEFSVVEVTIGDYRAVLPEGVLFSPGVRDPVAKELASALGGLKVRKLSRS